MRNKKYIAIVGLMFGSSALVWSGYQLFGVFSDTQNKAYDSSIDGARVINDRYVVTGGFDAQEITEIIRNIESGNDPGTEFSARVDRPDQSSENRSQVHPYNAITQGEEGLGDATGFISIGSNDEKDDIRATIIGSAETVDDQTCFQATGEACRYGRANSDGISCTICVNGANASGVGDGKRCYLRPDGEVYCAASPAFSISPLADPSLVSDKILPACGYNQVRGEQTGEDELPREDVGICLDITHSAWSPCGPGTDPRGNEEERSRGIDILAPPAITAGGCQLPCGCAALPSGNCRGNQWCVGPPGSTCAVGLSCNVCCQGTGYLWDAVSGWCGCADA